jgi:ketosteroid isomerase-like protein
MTTPAEDEQAIRNLAAAYSDAVNRGSAEGMVEVYSVDGALSAFGAADVVGHAALKATFEKVVSDHRWIFQMTHTGIVEVDGDIAWCRWWVSEHALRNDGSGTEFKGIYQDRVVRTSGGWRFARRVLNAVYIGRRSFEGKTFPRTVIEPGPVGRR